MKKIMVKLGAETLSEQQYDKRDFLVGNVLNLDKVVELKEVMRPISETYYQGNLGSCTSMGTSHSIKSSNEEEYKHPVEVVWKDLRQKMGHSTTKYDGGDIVENAVKTALKLGVEGSINGEKIIFNSDAWCYGKRDTRKKSLQITPLICIFKGNSQLWKEMLNGEVITIKKGTDGHCVLLAGRDEYYAYFYNSWEDKDYKNNISSFKISLDRLQLAVECGMMNRRRFGLIDKKDLNVNAVEIELSKQIIAVAKKLYEKGDAEMQAKFKERGITDFLQKKYGFTYTQ